MKTFLSIIMAGVLILVPFAGFGQIQQTAPPPVSQPLVREGEFALKLADRLNLISSGVEAEAENALASIGIAPLNGWIADYPITPDVAGELEIAITQAADSGKLPLNRDEALMAYRALCDEVGLFFIADSGAGFVQNQMPVDYGQYLNPDVINNYYYSEEPPVVTYYPPPPDYDYMYEWVAYPFWSSGFRFPGFYILNDFHRPIYGHGGRHFVSNHYQDSQSHRTYTVDPGMRHSGKDFNREGNLSNGRGFRSAEARNGAASIYERSGRGNPNGTNSTRSGGHFQSGFSTNRGNSPFFSNSPNNGTEKRSATWGNRNEAVPRNSDGRPLGQQRSFEGSSRAPSVGANRSFTAPSTVSRGSYGNISRAPAVSGNRSSSPTPGTFSRPSASPSLGSRTPSVSSFRAPSVGTNRSFAAPSTVSRGSYGNISRAPAVSGNRSFSPTPGTFSRPSASPSLGSRTPSASPFRAPSVGANRSFTAPSTVSRGSYGNISRAPAVSGNRSFSPTPGTFSRPSASPSLGSRTPSASSFRAPSVGANRSFTAPSTASRGSYSSRTPQGAGRSGGFGHSGLSIR